MEIKKKNSEEVKILTLDAGDCFECEGKYYLVINEGGLKIDVSSKTCFTVNLETGILTAFYPNMTVKKIQANVVIE